MSQLQPWYFAKKAANKSIAASAIGLFCLYFSPVQAADALPGVSDAREPPARITLSATAATEVAQDWMVVSLSTSKDGADAQAVQSQLQRALQAALDTAKPQVAAGRMALHTGSLQVVPRHGRDGKISGWQGSVSLTLEGQDFERMGAVSTQIATMTLADVSFGLSPQARVSLEADLQAQAIERFRAKAQQAAVSFGHTAYRVHEVNVGAIDGGGSSPRPMMAMVARSAMAEAAPPMPSEPGRTRVQLSVNGSVTLR